MLFEDYLSHIPLLHTWDRGETWNTGGFEEFHFRPLHELITEVVPDGPTFIETGAGNSTIFFLLHKPRRVVSIAPDKELFTRIRQYCHDHEIPTEPLEAHVDGSEWVLPSLARTTPASFDFALIDGDHSLERTIIDFFYLNHMLKQGGLLMIDDLNVHPAKEVVRLIRDEPDFTPVLDLRKAMVFRKETDRPTLRAWCDQTYIRREMGLFSKGDPFRIDRPSPDEAPDPDFDQGANYRAVRRL